MKGKIARNRWSLVAGTVALALFSVSAPASAGQRPLSDFLDRQSTFCFVFTDQGLDCAASGYFDEETCASKNGFIIGPSFPDLWFDPKTGINAGVDALGQENELFLEGELPTTVVGSISESSLPGGLANVKITAHGSNVLMRAFTFDADFNPIPLFGHLLFEVQDGAPPTLGDSLAQLTFTNTALGAPLPDLTQLLACPELGQALEVISVQAQASGPLREGFGVPEGTPGRLEVTQRGLLGTAGIANPVSRLGLDAFPAEKIIIRATGK